MFAVVVADSRRDENETKTFPTINIRTHALANSNNTKRQRDATNTRTPPSLLLFALRSRSRPTFTHAMRRDRPGRTVAMRMLRTSPSITRIIVSEIPTLAGEDREPASGARHRLAGLETPPPLAAQPAVRRVIAALAAARTLMVTHDLMVTTVARLVGDEDGAEMVGAASHGRGLWDCRSLIDGGAGPTAGKVTAAAPQSGAQCSLMKGRSRPTTPTAYYGDSLTVSL